MTRRWPALLAIPALLVVALVADQGTEGAARDEASAQAEATSARRRMMPTAAGDDALTSTWYCAGGTAEEDGAANQTVVVYNPTDRPTTGSITAYPSEGEPETVREEVPARGQVRVELVDLVSAPYRVGPGRVPRWRDRGRARGAGPERGRRRTVRVLGLGRVALRRGCDDPRRVGRARAVQPVSRAGHGRHRPRPRGWAPADPGLAPGPPGAGPVGRRGPGHRRPPAAGLGDRGGQGRPDRGRPHPDLQRAGCRQHGGGGRGGGVQGEGPRRHPRRSHARPDVDVPLRREGRRPPRALRHLQPR